MLSTSKNMQLYSFGNFTIMHTRTMTTLFQTKNKQTKTKTMDFPINIIE
jgi:hypothetical protein